MKFIISIILLFNITISYSQKVDSVYVKDKFFNTIYLRTMPIGIYTGASYLKDKITQNFEFGKSVGMFDIGLAIGQTALRKDTLGNGNKFLEGKITMDVCQYGIFSNEMTVGAGYVFFSENFMMLEISYTIYAQFWKRMGMGITTGYVDYSGNYTDASHNQFGLFLRYGLLREETGGLLNMAARTHHFHR
jgi:hypothetical protein